MLKQVNVAIEESIYDDAKSAAVRRGMLFRKWIEFALQQALANEKPANTRELKYGPLEGE